MVDFVFEGHGKPPRSEFRIAVQADSLRHALLTALNQGRGSTRSGVSTRKECPSGRERPMARLELMPPPIRQEYEDWIQQHQRTGGPERRRRLRNGLGHAELSFLGQVWLPAVGRLTNLHPEYEVADYSGAPRFLDFAYLRGGVKLAIEIDGFHAHVVDMDRTKFANDLHRQNLLTL